MLRWTWEQPAYRNKILNYNYGRQYLVIILVDLSDFSFQTDTGHNYPDSTSLSDIYHSIGPLVAKGDKPISQFSGDKPIGQSNVGSKATNQSVTCTFQPLFNYFFCVNFFY